MINKQKSLHIPKYGGNLACWCLGLWSLWTAFTCCCLLSWLLIWLYSEVVDPCFICCHISMQKLLLVALKLLQTKLWIVNVLLFLIDCEQTQHPLWTKLYYWQMFMQNVEYTAFWYLQLLCYLTQLLVRIGQNEFVEFFGVFWYSIPPLNHCFQWSRVNNTY